ncbi:YfiR family protein [Ekhidna sp.]
MQRIILSITILLISSLGVKLSAQIGKFQALYLLNFTKNIEWSENNVTIGVVGNSKALIELESLVEKYPNLSLRKISASESVDQCQMIFLPTSQSRNISLIQDKIGNKPIVLVSEDESMIDKGAEIAFYMEGNKLKFLINKSAVEESGVSVGEKLFSVGKVVN